MALDEGLLKARAKRAYELGRLSSALRMAWFMPPMIAVSLLGCGRPLPTVGLGLLASLAIVELAWRGEGYRRAIWPGLLGGLAPFLVPLLAQLTGHCVVGTDSSFVVAVCAGGGVLGGVLVGLGVARISERSPSALGASVLVAGLTGSLGCVLAGVSGVLGMMGGILLSAAPVYLALAPATRTR